MIPPPPRVVRRLVLDPLVVGVCLVVAALSPVAAVVVAPYAVFRRSRKPIAIVQLVASFAAREAFGVVAMTLLWLLSGCGLLLRRDWMQRAHYALMRWWIDGLFTIARSRLGLEVQLSRPELPDSPLIVLARHAGMGDSLLLVRMLLHLDRRPRIVLQQALQWDPCVDIVGHRVPTVFVPVRADLRRRCIPAIGALARHMRPHDVVVLFPEGGNFTAARHRRAVDRLRREGAEELALRAERLVHLLPPKAPGARALLLAAPTVPVVVAAHAGLEHLDTVRATLRNLPLQRPVALHWSVVAAGCVPTDEPVLVDWLFSRWEEMDGWVSAVLAGTTYPPAEGVQPAVTTTPGAGRRASSGIS